MLTNLLSFVSWIFNRFSYSAIGNRQPFERSVASLSLRDRESLLHEDSGVLNGPSSDDASLLQLVRGDGIDGSLEEVDCCDIELGICKQETALKECRELLRTFEVKERFLGMRIRTYRRRLGQLGANYDGTATKMSRSNLENTSDGDAKSQSRSQQERHCRDELQSVEKVHKGIIAQMEMLRRKIHNMEERMKNYTSMKDECREIILAGSMTAQAEG